MISAKFIKGSLAAAALNLVLFFPTAATPLSTDIQNSIEVGPDGGYLDGEDPETGVSFGILFPEGALAEKTTITLIIYGSPHPGVLGKTYINGIAILPENLLLLEKASLHVYNPPGDVRSDMLLYHIAGEKFIIPLGSQIIHEEENWIEGTFYSTGRFSLGSPTAAEASTQALKLSAYSPARPLAYGGLESDPPARILRDDQDTFLLSGGPFAIPDELNLSIPEYNAPDPAECIRWQRVLTKVEGHMTWIIQFSRTNNQAAEQAERDKARDALQDAIDEYLNRPSPANRCSSYTRAAAKYTEAATLLGMNIKDEAPIAQHFNKLVDECSFVFTVETHEWINHPKETLNDGATLEEKSNWYGTIKCNIPWNDFIATGNQEIRGEGNMNLHYEHHWVGDEKNEHIVTNGTWRTDKIEGAVTVSDDGHGQLLSEANVTIYWSKKVTTHMWGKPGLYDDPYDETSTDTRSYSESKSYPLKNGYEMKIGNSTAGISIRVNILKQPGDGRYDPDDCF